MYHNVGYKFGVWHDVSWWERPLRPHDPKPAAPLPLSEIINGAGWHKAIAAGVSLLRL